MLDLFCLSSGASPALPHTSSASIALLSSLAWVEPGWTCSPCPCCCRLSSWCCTGMQEQEVAAPPWRWTIIQCCILPSLTPGSLYILRGTTSAWQSIQQWVSALCYRGHLCRQKDCKDLLMAGWCQGSGALQGDCTGYGLVMCRLGVILERSRESICPRFYAFSAVSIGPERFIFTLCCFKFLTTCWKRILISSQCFLVLIVVS